MKVVILAGGFGTRISEESHLKPKPMIEIGGMPILWHIMKSYSAHGYNEFVICCGYKQHVIKDFFNDYFLHASDVTFDFTNSTNRMKVHKTFSEQWKVTLVDTGLNTMTGGRIKRIRKYIGDEPFMLTYGDGVCDVDINALEQFHREHGKLATITVVNAGQRFGIIDMDDDQKVTSFREKRDVDGHPINGGYMVLDPKVFDLIEGDSTVFEKKPLETLAKQGELMAFHHTGFWQCMDTKRDMDYLEELLRSGNAPWKKWEE
ncbi:MAG: glucose-1-phosphate cytidylyltransferase [Ruminococcaceae bacterium]|nr:glucose-1-phosphate cytidylyltransferase [Oscillospiraceae bacterium]